MSSKNFDSDNMILMKVVNMENDDKPDSANMSKFMLSKAVINLDLSKHNGIKELLNYISNEDVELNKVKILVKKANAELRTHGRQLFIRGASSRDRKAENRICMTRR